MKIIAIESFQHVADLLEETAPDFGVTVSKGPAGTWAVTKSAERVPQFHVSQFLFHRGAFVPLTQEAHDEMAAWLTRKASVEAGQRP